MYLITPLRQGGITVDVVQKGQELSLFVPGHRKAKSEEKTFSTQRLKDLGMAQLDEIAPRSGQRKAPVKSSKHYSAAELGKMTKSQLVELGVEELSSSMTKAEMLKVLAGYDIEK